MSELGWKDGASVIAVLSTELNSDVTGQLTVSGVINTDASNDLYCDIEVLHGTYGSSVNAGTKVCDIYLLPTVDGTNFPTNDADSTTLYPEAKYIVGSAQKMSATGTGGMRSIITGVPLPARDCKFAHLNTSGVTLASSGNQLNIRIYRAQSV